MAAHQDKQHRQPAYPNDDNGGGADSPSRITPPTLLTVRQFAARHPAFTEAALRWHIFNAQDRTSTQGIVRGNGLERAIVRVGRRVLIDESEFFAWLRDQQRTGA